MRYGFAKFRLGQAFYFYGVDPARARSAAHVFAHKHGWKFITSIKSKSILIERVA